jgi:hypothetical protein
MKKAIFPIIGCVLGLVSGGCVTQQPLPLGIRTESHSAGGVKIVGVNLFEDKNELLIHGIVQSDLGYYGSIFRHLDVAVYGPSGELLVAQPIGFFPNPIPASRVGSGRSSFAVRFTQTIPPNSTVSVVVDCVSISKCKMNYR